MKAAIFVLCSMVVMAAAYWEEPHYGRRDHYGYGFQRGYGGIQAVYNNAFRQKGVNKLAEGVRAGTGTAFLYGVPGTGNYFNRLHYPSGGKDNFNKPYSMHG